MAQDPITYTVRNFIDASQAKKDLAFSTNDLTGGMVSQASLIAHYGELAADAARQVDSLKMILENAEAVTYQTLRKQMAAAGEKITEAQLEKMVATHNSVVGLKRALADARRIEAICKSTVEAFRHRRDMLIQLGAQGRAEMQGELRTSVHTPAGRAAMEAQVVALNRAGANSDG